VIPTVGGTYCDRGLTNVLQAKALQFLDLSQNSLDKRSIEYIANGLPQAPEPGLSSLKLDDCFLKPQALEALGTLVYEAFPRDFVD
jgi:protein phosphatase 1 regulatory subunit 37